MPLLNTILRKNLKKKTIRIFTIGFLSKDISINVSNLGNNLIQLFNILENKSSYNYFYYYNSFFLSSFFNLKNYLNNAIIIGENFFFIKNAFKLLSNLYYLLNFKYNDIYILFTNVIDLNSQEINIKKKKRKSKKRKKIYSITFDILKKKKKKNFSIFKKFFFFKNFKKFYFIFIFFFFFFFLIFFLNI